MAEAMAAVADGGPLAKKKAGRPPSEDQNRRKASFATWQTSPACTEVIACVDLKCLEDNFADGFFHCLCGTSISLTASGLLGGRFILSQPSALCGSLVPGGFLMKLNVELFN